MIVLRTVDVLLPVVVELVVTVVPPVGGGGGLLPPGPPSAKAAGEANKASIPERTSNRREFFIGRGIL